jgi:hypothetical protein
MIDLGIAKPGETIYCEFETYGASAESITITGLAVTDIEIYKNGSVTQRSSDAGYTLLDTDGIDFDGVTGIHGFSVSLADNTDAGFYSAGAHYRIVVNAITVNSQTVVFSFKFKIGYSNALINTTIATLASQTSFTLTAGPAEDDALNGMWAIIHDVASAVQLGQALILDYTGSTKTVTLVAGTTFTAAATDNISVMGIAPLQPTVLGRTLDVTATGAAGIDWGNIENKTTANDLSATDIQLVDTVTTYTGNTVQTGDSFARLGAPAGASVSADIAAVKVDTAAILIDTTEIGVAGAGLTNINLPDQTMDIVGNITGNLSGSVGSVTGSVGSVTGAVGSVTGNVGGNVVGSVASVTAAVTANMTQISGSTTAADNLERGAVALVLGTAITGTLTTTAFTTDLTEVTDDHYNGRVITFTSGALAGQSTDITDYTGATKLVTVTAMTEAPSNTDAFVIS